MTRQTTPHTGETKDGRPSKPYEDRCDRCGGRIDRGFAGQLGIASPQGFVWIAVGAKVVLCLSCKEDLEESVDSYGEGARKRRSRFMARLKEIRTDQ